MQLAEYTHTHFEIREYEGHSISPYVDSFYNDVILTSYGFYRSVDALLHAVLIFKLINWY